MRIFVVPRKYIKMFMHTDMFFKHNNFISIGEAAGYEGVPVNTENVLKLVFDDMSDKETVGTLFTEEHAIQIKNFVDRIDKSKTLYTVKIYKQYIENFKLENNAYFLIKIR